jgi:hypothetical protein
MRLIPAFALLIAACSSETAGPSLATGSFAGEGRDRLCIAGEGQNLRAGFIAYGDGDANCSASGSLTQADGQWTLVPRGESANGCRVGLTIANGTASIAPAGADCAYYCGPGVDLAGKSFDLGKPAAAPATDLAGDPLC